MALPFIAVAKVISLVVGGGVFATVLNSIDDTVEEINGEKSGISPLFLIALIAGGAFLYFKFFRKK